MTQTAAPSDSYDQLREEGWKHLKAGRLDQAREIFDRAYDLARESDDPTLLDVAFCNRAAVAIRQRQAGDAVPRLQEMLLRTVDSRVAMLSAYNLALAYDDRKEHKKVLFYGQLAQKYSIELGERDLQASAVNILGNARNALGDFDSAITAYREALELFTDEDGLRQALVLDNLGYSILLEGRTDEGFRLLVQSLRMVRKNGGHMFEIGPRLSLAFAYLQVDRPRPALRHLHRALELAEETHHIEGIKTGLLLLGEAYKQDADLPAARDCFQILQETYYPTMPDVPDMLLGIDVAKVINIKA